MSCPGGCPGVCVCPGGVCPRRCVQGVYVSGGAGCSGGVQRRGVSREGVCPGGV